MLVMKYVSWHTADRMGKLFKNTVMFEIPNSISWLYRGMTNTQYVLSTVFEEVGVI